MLPTSLQSCSSQVEPLLALQLVGSCLRSPEHCCSSQQGLDSGVLGTSPLLAGVPWLTAPLGTNPAQDKKEEGDKGWGRGLARSYTSCFPFPNRSPPPISLSIFDAFFLKQRTEGEGRQVEQGGGTQQGLQARTWQGGKMGRNPQSWGEVCDSIAGHRAGISWRVHLKEF